jgi:hypothetical protein
LLFDNNSQGYILYRQALNRWTTTQNDRRVRPTRLHATDSNEIGCEALNLGRRPHDEAVELDA